MPTETDRIIDPIFPPLLKGRGLEASQHPLDWAKARTEKGELSAGDLIWSQDTENLRLALVLEPEVQREQCAEMLFVAMVALGDAVGAQIPAVIGIHYQWPGTILMNNGRVGYADLCVSDNETDGVPESMVLYIELNVIPDTTNANPGDEVEITTMWEEGCSDITRNDLLESIARHILAMIYTWSEDGFAQIHSQWTDRLYEEKQLAQGVDDSEKFIGLDENGNALVSKDKATASISVFDGLDIQRKLRLSAK